MNNFTLHSIREKLKNPLPGWEAQKIMAPSYREVELEQAKHMISKAKKSAVLILLYEKEGLLHIPFIKRAEYDGAHSGQISLPGGQFEKADDSFEFTARRETEEEIGIKRDEIIFMGQISDLYIPPSNYLVKTFVGYLPYQPNFIIDTKEVQKVIEISLDSFFESDVVKEKPFVSSSSGATKKAPYFEVENIEIWGATAMIISEFIEIIR